MAKFRYVDGRQFEPKPDGSWGPTERQTEMDARRAVRPEYVEPRAAPAHLQQRNDALTYSLLALALLK